MPNSENERPIKEFRIGGIKVAIWSKEVEQGGQTSVRHSIRIQKRFKPEGADWRDTDYYFPEELPKVRLLIDRAYEFVSNLKEGNPESTSP